MNGSRGWGVSVFSAAVAAALTLGAAFALAPGGSARAAPALEFSLDFSNLQPGVPQTEVGTFELEQDADLVTFDWIERVGLLAEAGPQAGERVVIEVVVCDSVGTCLDPRAITDPVPFAAGTGSLSVTLQLSDAVEPGESGSVVGRLTFVAEDAPGLPGGEGPAAGGGGLALTGPDAAPWIAAGAASIAVGALVFALVRRRGDARDQRPG
jgi:hypothetical protein